MRGRTPSGPEYVDRLSGSETAKERLKVVLETMTGAARVREACERLQICEQRFHQLRQQMMEAALAALEPRSPGRPAGAASGGAASAADEQVRVLEEQLLAKDVELRAAKVREELALALPRVVHEPPAPKKKRRGEPRKP
jgi:helix-turn-helix protein